jgi:hypothetical protein
MITQVGSAIAKITAALRRGPAAALRDRFAPTSASEALPLLASRVHDVAT